MNRQSLNYNYGVNSQAVFIVLGTLFLGLFFALLSVLLPWYMGLGLVILPTLLVFSAIKPHVGLIFILMLIFEVIPSIFQPKLPFFGGGLTIFDVFIVYLTFLLLLRALWAKSHPLKEIGVVRWPLYYLYASILSSLVYVKYFAPNSFVMAETRVFIVWLLIPLISMSITSFKQYRGFMNWMIVIAIIISVYVSIQSIFGIQIMTGSRVEAMAETANEDVIRSIAGGSIYVIIFFVYLFSNRWLDGRMSSLRALPLLLLFLVAIAVQFGRGIWVAAAVGLMLSAFLHRGWLGLIKTLVIGGVVLAMMLTALYAVRPATTRSLIQRATGIGEEVERGGSFAWRKQENRYAMMAIKKHPWTGVGLGGEYKQTISTAGHFDLETIYIHNGYLRFPLKMGVFASLVPFAFIAAFIALTRQAAVRDRALSGSYDRSFIAALSGAFFVPVITSYTQGEWENPGGIAAFCVFYGLALLYQRYGSPHREDRVVPRVS